MKPFKIKAYGQTWKVRILKKHPKLKGDYGCFDHVSSSILIDATSSNEQQKVTLIHEILHLIEHCSEMDFTEKQITSLESGLYMILHDNKLKF